MPVEAILEVTLSSCSLLPVLNMIGLKHSTDFFKTRDEQKTSTENIRKLPCYFAPMLARECGVKAWSSVCVCVCVCVCACVEGFKAWETYRAFEERVLTFTPAQDKFVHSHLLLSSLLHTSL